MTTVDVERLRQIKTLPSLVKYLRDELDWPIDSEDMEDITFEYDPAELGFESSAAVQIKEIKQLRPLDSKQPWGIFWVNFEKKSLPVVMLRRVLGHLVIKKRASGNRATQRAWHLNDLLFISAYGEEHDRAITLAHFWQDTDSPGELPVLKVLGWDNADTILHLADAHRTLSERLRWPDDPSDIESWRKKWAATFTLRHREVIQTTQQLVSELAILAVEIRKRTSTILARESKNGPVRRLYASFQATLIHDLTEDDFADVIAQTVTYGLLAAKFSCPAGISVSNLVDMIPPTNTFLRELLGTFLSLGGRKGAFDFDELGFQDVVEVLNEANTDAVKTDFGNRTRNEDPIIHFYEHFLSAYDKEKKVKRGVFYTPQPVVSYIVRSVHELLQTEFGLEDGLASTVTWGEMVKRHPEIKLPKIWVEKKGKAKGEEVELSPDEFFVQVLDIATGTATFLVEVIEVIFNHLQAKWNSGNGILPVILGQGRGARDAFKTFTEYWNAYVPCALLPRLYGYELMMAPYTIAHMKLGLKLSEINARLGQPDYQLKFEGRAHIYLTNSLEPASDLGQQDLAGIFPALAHEAQAVNAVKRYKCFTVVIGNPPYSVSSTNRSNFIEKEMEVYKQDVKGEKNIQPLSDDYIKFVRFAHLNIEKSSCGISGMITNNVYLSGLIHRGMRKTLLQTFQDIFILNLHGNSRVREKSPNGGKDKNVFDIQQGVTVSFYIKKFGDHRGRKGIYCADLWGPREDKYRYLAESTSATTNWQALEPVTPYYFLVPKDFTRQEEYEKYWKLSEIYQEGQIGLMTGQDEFFIHTDLQALKAKILSVFNRSLSDDKLKTLYNLNSQAGEKMINARKSVNFCHDLIRPYCYRPFDTRFIYAENKFLWRSVESLCKHFASENIALVATRILAKPPFTHVFVTRHLGDNTFISNETKERNYFFPLYLCLQGSNSQLFGNKTDRKEKAVNFTPAFIQAVTTSFDERLPPEQIFHHIYAVLHSPSYRARYEEFLNIDHPRIPITSSAELFGSLAELGAELISFHLMESPKLNRPITKWKGNTPSSEVEKVLYADATVWIDKAQTEGFRGVLENVWNFHIGGYQVCEKWLKDRKGRKLSADDITHYQKIVVALNETIRLMGEIDKVIEKHGGWPGAFLPAKQP
jgi:hypothetical protein